MISKAKLIHKLDRLKQQRAEYDKPDSYYSFHGAKAIGYLDGMIKVIGDWIDEYEEDETKDEGL